MDVIAAGRVLIEIADRGSVTNAAAAVGIAQSVASRRIASLERHLGGPLLERTARSAVLTPLARDLLPSLRRLVALADELEIDAERARLRPVTIAIPRGCAIRDLAVVEAEAAARGLRVEFREAAPARRAELAAKRSVRAAVASVPLDRATWEAELGVAGRRPATAALRLGALRPRRGGRVRDGEAGACLRLTPEDDVPHVRDGLMRAAFAAGMLPGQLPVDGSISSAVARVLGRGDLLLCTRSEALQLGLHWRELREPRLRRGFALIGDSAHDLELICEAIADELAAALGAADASRPARETEDAHD